MKTCLWMLTAFFCISIAFAQDEKVKLAEPVEFPVVINGKQVGKTKLAAGTEVQVLQREGSRVQIKYRASDPAWVDASKISASDGAPTAATTGTSSATPFDPASAIEAIRQGDYRTALRSLSNLSHPDTTYLNRVKDFVSKLSQAVASLDKAQAAQQAAATEAQRLRRNAKVIDRPNPLDERDRSPQERAQEMRDRADAVGTNAEQAMNAAAKSISDASSDLITALREWDHSKADAHGSAARATASAKTTRSPNYEASCNSGNRAEGVAERVTVIPKSESLTDPEEFTFFVDTVFGANVKNMAAGDLPIHSERANAGDNRSQFVMAVATTLGVGATQNPEKGFQWLSMSASGGYLLAQKVLASVYIEGYGVPKDKAAARRWLTKAADQGDVKARQTLDELSDGKTSEDKSTDSSIAQREASNSSQPGGRKGGFTGLTPEAIRGIQLWCGDDKEIIDWIEGRFAQVNISNEIASKAVGADLGQIILLPATELRNGGVAARLKRAVSSYIKDWEADFNGMRTKQGY